MKPGRPPAGAEERIRIKRIYRAARNSDGKRILVDRVWPRGMLKERARLHAWMRDLAPSDSLRKWFHDNTDCWDEFKLRYYNEIENSDEICQLLEAARNEVVTLLYASADENRNNAVALREYLLGRVERSEESPHPSLCRASKDVNDE